MKKSLAALAAIGAIVGGLPAGMQVVVAGSGPEFSQTSANSKSTGTTLAQQVARDIASIWRAPGYSRRRRAYVGKRYRASVRQHQRHAAKARRRSAAR